MNKSSEILVLLQFAFQNSINDEILFEILPIFLFLQLLFI